MHIHKNLKLTMTQDTEQKGLGQIPLHGYITYAEALRLIADAIGNLKIYVSEAEITQAQQAALKAETQSRF